MRTRTKNRSCNEKRRYDSREAAEGALWTLHRRRKANGFLMHAYACDHCGGWHIGHKGRR